MRTREYFLCKSSTTTANDYTSDVTFSGYLPHFMTYSAHVVLLSLVRAR
jgi:hypothetical protein